MICKAVLLLLFSFVFPSKSKDLCKIPCVQYGHLKRYNSDLNPEIKSDLFSESGLVDSVKSQQEEGPTDSDERGAIRSKVEMRLMSRARDCAMILSGCVRDSDCCTGYCQPMMGHCLFNPFHRPETLECRPNLQECLFNYQCCSKKCDPVTGMCLDEYVTLHPPVMTSHQTCSLEAGTCQVDYHCCSNLCNTTSGSCMGNSKTDAAQRIHLKSGSSKLVRSAPEKLYEREKIITATELVQNIGVQERLFEEDIIKASSTEEVYKQR